MLNRAIQRLAWVPSRSHDVSHRSAGRKVVAEVERVKTARTCPYAYLSPNDPQVSASVQTDTTKTDFEMFVGYDEVKVAARDWKRFSSDTPGRVPIPHELDARDVRQLPIETDPPAHTKYRAVVADLFSRNTVASLEPAIRNVVSATIKDFLARGSVDLVEDFAVPIVMSSLAIALGRSQREADEWMTWGRTVFGVDEDGNKSHNSRFDEYVSSAVDDAMSNPGDDFFGLLARARIDGVVLTRDEMLGYGNLVFAGGRSTLFDSISTAVWYLGVETRDRDKLVADPGLIPMAVEEFLRYFSPLSHLGRTATESVETPRGAIQKGDLISLGFAFANHDPKVFDRADVCVIDRKQNHHVAFGHGPHTCIGAHLARLEVRIVLEEILSRSPDYEVEVAPTFRFLDLGFASIPDGIESCKLTKSRG